MSTPVAVVLGDAPMPTPTPVAVLPDTSGVASIGQPVQLPVTGAGPEAGAVSWLLVLLVIVTGAMLAARMRGGR